jgi:hypothetical protein
MKPAFHISLTSGEKVLITELAAIQSQIEWIMRLTVQHLLSVSPDTARLLMGSTSIETNSNLWINIVREKHHDKVAKEWAEFAFARVKELSKGRNDFLHTLYGFSAQDFPNLSGASPIGSIAFMYGHVVTKREMANPRRAIRVRSSASVPLSDLKQTRDSAAYLSVVFAHVEATSNPTPNERAPWLRRLGSKHPPQSQSVKPKTGKGRERPHKP